MSSQLRMGKCCKYEYNVHAKNVFWLMYIQMLYLRIVLTDFKLFCNLQIFIYIVAKTWQFIMRISCMVSWDIGFVWYCVFISFALKTFGSGEWQGYKIVRKTIVNIFGDSLLIHVWLYMPYIPVCTCNKAIIIDVSRIKWCCTTASDLKTNGV